jgi:hypothetical protein
VLTSEVPWKNLVVNELFKFSRFDPPELRGGALHSLPIFPDVLKHTSTFALFSGDVR